MSPLSVAVAVPTLNEAYRVGALLERLLQQDIEPGRLQIVIADGGSTDGTVDAVRAAIAARTSDQPTILLIDNPERVPAGAFNRAIDATTTDVVIVLGAHSLVGQDWVRRSVEALERSGADVAGGVIETRGTGATGQAIAAAMASRFGVGAALFRIGSTEAREVDTVAFGAYRRRVFDVVGRFDLELVGAEDDEFNWRVVQAGLRIWLDPTIVMSYYCRDSYRRLFAQYHGYGRGKAHVLRKHRRLPSTRMVAPPALVTTLAIAAVVAPVRRFRGLFALLAGAYGLALVGAARAEGGRRPWRVAAAFATMHISYGLGVLRGLTERRSS
jgi:GT2 family glycosyltransferase